MQLFVGGQSFEVRPEDTVLSLREKIEVAFGYPANGRYELHLVSDNHARFARFGRFDNEPWEKSDYKITMYFGSILECNALSRDTIDVPALV